MQAQIKDNIKGPRPWLLCGEFTGDRWIPRTIGTNAENVSIWWRHHDVHVYANIIAYLFNLLYKVHSLRRLAETSVIPGLLPMTQMPN